MAILKKNYYRVYAVSSGIYSGLNIVDDECFVQEPDQASQCGLAMHREYAARYSFWSVMTEKISRGQSAQAE